MLALLGLESGRERASAMRQDGLPDSSWLPEWGTAKAARTWLAPHAIGDALLYHMVFEI
jgi:hypothetical protein